MYKVLCGCSRSHVNNIDAVKAHFERQGHKNFYVNNLLSHIQSLHDTVHMWRKQVFTKDQLSHSHSSVGCVYQLDSVQNSIFNHVMGCLCKRDGFYSMREDDVDHDDETYNVETGVSTTVPTDWRKFTLLTGKPGTGKSHVLLALIEKCISQGRKILKGCLCKTTHSILCKK